MASLAHHQLMSQQRPHFSPHSKAIANYKSTNLRKIGNGSGRIIYNGKNILLATVLSRA